MCQRGKEGDTVEPLYKGTSKAAEGCGANDAFERAFKDGMNIEAHW